MLNIDEILFSKNNSTKLNKHQDILFNTSIDWDTDTVSVDVSYAFLKKEKKIGDNTILIEEPLIVIGFFEETNMFNVCTSSKELEIFFWVNSSEISDIKIMVEDWTIDEVRRHYKAINEKWTYTEKNTTKELKKKRNSQKKND